MLYKNDDLVTVTDAMKLEVYKALGIELDKDKKPKNPKFSMKIKMPDYMYTMSEGNKKPDRPSYCVIPLNAQREGADGSEKWNYATGRNKGKDDRWQYFSTDNGPRQSHLQFETSYDISAGKIDLMYFLLFLSPLREIIGETPEQKQKRGVKPNQRFQFVVENREHESTVRIISKKTRIQVEHAIMEGLKLEDIRKIAAAFEIVASDTKGEMTLRDELFTAVELMESTGARGYEKFLEVSKFGEITDIKGTIQKGIDSGVIKEDPKTKTFCYLNSEGKFTNKITGTSAGRTLRESLEYYLQKNPAELDKLKVAIEEKELVES